MVSNKDVVAKVQGDLQHLKALATHYFLQKRKKGMKMEQINATLHKKEFWSWIFIIIVIPLLASTVDAFQTYVITGIWDWSSITIVLAFSIAPTVVAYLKKVYDSEKEEKDKQISLLQNQLESKERAHEVQMMNLRFEFQDKENGLKVSNSLYKQLLDLNKVDYKD